MRYVYCSLVLCVLAASVVAEGAPDKQFNFYFDNDLFLDTDFDYTSGLRLSFTSIDDGAGRLWPISAVRAVNLGLGKIPQLSLENGGPINQSFVFSLGHEMYTAKDIDRRTLDRSDRPYAAWLYAGIAYHSRTRHKMNSVELDVGVVGPSALGQAAQAATLHPRAAPVRHRSPAGQQWSLGPGRGACPRGGGVRGTRGRARGRGARASQRRDPPHRDPVPYPVHPIIPKNGIRNRRVGTVFVVKRSAHRRRVVLADRAVHDRDVRRR